MRLGDAKGKRKAESNWKMGLGQDGNWAARPLVGGLPSALSLDSLFVADAAGDEDDRDSAAPPDVWTTSEDCIELGLSDHVFLGMTTVQYQVDDKRTPMYFA